MPTDTIRLPTSSIQERVGGKIWVESRRFQDIKQIIEDKT